MTISPITTCSRRAVYVGGNFGNKMLGSICTVSQSPTNLCCSFFHYGQSQRRCSAVTICSSIGSQFEGRFLVSGFSKPRRNSPPLMMRNSVSSTGDQTAHLGLSSRGRNMSLRLSVPSHERVSQISWSTKPANRRKGSASTGLIVGLFVCFAYSEPVKAEIAKRTKTMDDDVDEDKDDSSSASTSHGKKVYTDYSVTGIPGDGRCLFRSVVHGACLRSGKPSPDESLQKELADELRSRVADEFVKRREETEWFVEGDFDTHISKIREPHVWGGEPELLMASHVLQMPITVYMHDDDSGGLIAIAEYGQEYGKENPIRVLYHGYGHYDALYILGKKSAKSRLVWHTRHMK